MAKGNKGGKGSGGGRGKMTVVMFQLEGSDETIQEGFRVFGEALDKMVPAVPAYRSLPPAHQQNPSMIEDQTDQVDDQYNEAPTQPELSEELPKPKRVRASSRRAPTMSIVKELDLRPEGKLSLQDFYSRKSPEKQQEKLVVFVYYLAKILEVPGITPHHVYTCFKDVGERTPKDLPQSLRNVANRRGWVDSADQDNIKITNHGENFVEHDLPKNIADQESAL